MSSVTTAEPVLPPPEPGWVPPRIYRMTVDEYEAMVASGGSSPAAGSI